MRNTKKFLIIGIIIIIAIVFFIFFSKGWTKTPPDLHESKWKSISVEYLVGDNKSERQFWSTTEQTVLDKLQSSFKITDGGDLWGYSEMTTNKIELELTNGRKYVIHFTSENEIVLNDYNHLKTGFGLDIIPDFHNTLKTIIESTKKESVYFY